MSDPAVAWASPPVDDVGYIPSASLLRLTDEELIDLVLDFERTRYQGWRNWNGNWRRVLKMDETEGRTVLDWGCGVGIEGLQYARSHNSVTFADIVFENVILADRVLRVFGFEPRAQDWGFDVIHAAGSLHHHPTPMEVVDMWHRRLLDGGEVRLMLYSDEAWRIATGTEPSYDAPEPALFNQYVRRWDAVGDYADWYDADKLERWFGDWFRLENFEYLTEDRAYCGAVMVKR